jgi:AraC-like DNA-binding protein
MLRQSHLPTFPGHRYFCFPASVGLYRDYPEHRVYRAQGSLNEFNLHFVAAGKGYVELGGRVHTLHKGDAFLFFPYAEQSYYSSEDDPWDIRWGHFYGDKVKEFLIERGFQRSTLWSLRQLKPLEDAHLALLQEAEEHAMLHETKLSALTYAFIVEFMNQAVPYASGGGVRTAERIAELLPEIRRKATEPFDLAYWAERAGVSVHYFCKLFRKATRMTPLAFVTLCRLQYGKQRLMEDPDLPVRQIALEAGYPSASYFDKRFREHEGMTPTEFRELYRRTGPFI